MIDTIDDAAWQKSRKHDIVQADFKLFTALWNQFQGRNTPSVHFKIAGWLERAWIKGDKRLLLMAFRSCGKSTLVGLFAAWLLYRKPELRIMVLAADEALAKKMVINARKIIEKHPLTGSLVPKNSDSWAGDRFTVKRMLEMRDPSMLAKGVTSNITGSRADIIICDDVEVPNTSDSAEKREGLRERLAELSFVLSPDGTQIYVGTPHHYYSIYAARPRTEIGEEREFLSGYKRLKLPILDSKGESVWPERFSAADIERIKDASGPNKFTSQMMLKPVNIADGRLNPDLLRWYDDEIDYTREINTLFIGERKMVSASAFWDPAFGSAKGDHSVMAVVFGDADGNYFLQHIEYVRLAPSPSSVKTPLSSPQWGEEGFSSVSVANLEKSGEGVIEKDEASAQCSIIAEICKRFMLPSMQIETNGIGKFLPNILRNELTKAHVPCRVLEVNQTRKKEERILEAFDALLAARRLYVHKSVQKTPFINEMREWRPERNKGHDDGLDAVAGALAQQPDRAKRLYGRGEFSWMRTGKAHVVDTDYGV